MFKKQNFDCGYQPCINTVSKTYQHREKSNSSVNGDIELSNKKRLVCQYLFVVLVSSNQIVYICKNQSFYNLCI